MDGGAVTPSQISAFCPAAGQYAAAIVAACAARGIDSPTVQAMFLGQYAHETQGFTKMQENLNYSVNGLLATFHRYFDAPTAANYARQQERIANRVYANRMGNGPESSGDGWRFRGRGLCHLTGRANYASYSKVVHGDDRCIENPDMLLLPEDAVGAGAWFWQTNGLNVIAAAGTEAAFEAVTKRVNGGLTGLEDRQAWWAKAQVALGIEG